MMSPVRRCVCFLIVKHTMNPDCLCPPESPTRELVLCFDGTGNTFRADGGESNILKIFRMLDRKKKDRCECLDVVMVTS